MTKDEALKLALKALKQNHYYMIDAGLPNQSMLNKNFDAMITIKEALAQPEQKLMHPQLKAMLEDYFDKCFAESKPKCNTHPKAPHGFNRNASHSADRYVCDCEGWDAYEAGRQDGVEAMLKYDNPTQYVFLTATEIVDCATAVYQCDPNDVTENDIKFARHIERLTLER